ncbi:MAG: flagellar basal body rod protein FlgC [Rhodothermales bacterium]
MISEHFFKVFRVASKGLSAQRTIMGAATENLANAGTTLTPGGTPYRAQRAVQTLPEGQRSPFRRTLARLSTHISMNTNDSRHETREGRSLSINSLRPEANAGPGVELTESDAQRVEYDPTHPHADASGYVRYPDVNVVDEMANLVSANRMYEANLASVQAMTQLVKRTIDI